ncbi:hypothetical protein [Cellulomonas wangsupingiae]|uniref:Reverse transcriptase domain-containing protein n=1 Tax=Cellulomonas wangsupingiae TaxID=2968085 RepID=A0ABY5K4N1_9CELL|nr:hypothetical protein [Cellulomonas wangsupingiae]MCC2333949.1 hypothetical protein [Cellulomonas wangsupingiae]UUI65204.1 hypothetical protein NP075_00195 [Cellulomonas wangsupingiae]
MQLPDIAAASPEALGEAVSKELSTHHRLLPPRHDYGALLGHVEAITRLMKGVAARPSIEPARGDVIFARKGWRGSRPLTVMALHDAVVYRFLCDRLAVQLPERLRSRPPAREFKELLLSEEDVTHIAVTDVTAYYEFVDHGLLADELVAQTGDEPLVVQLLTALRGVMGRDLGLPQIHQSSDILGDTYIDPVRRRLRRHGFKTLSYSDDFRIGATTLSEAKRALEVCSAEMRLLGLVQNERKTFTWSRERYQEDLGSFAAAERGLFEGVDVLQDFWVDLYGEEEELAEAASLAANPLGGGIDEGDVDFDTPGPASIPKYDVTPTLLSAAERALEIWLDEGEDDDTQSRKGAAITQSLLGRALPILGAGGSSGPLANASAILLYEPALTPQFASYLIQYSKRNGDRRVEVRDALDEIVDKAVLSDWQAIWIAYVAGFLRGSQASRPHVRWLHWAVEHGRDAVAAHAAAALGSIGRGDPETLAMGVGRVGPVWRSLALWGLARISTQLAEEVAEDGIERVLVGRPDGHGPQGRSAARPRRQRAKRS